MWYKLKHLELKAVQQSDQNIIPQVQTTRNSMNGEQNKTYDTDAMYSEVFYKKRDKFWRVHRENNIKI